MSLAALAVSWLLAYRVSQCPPEMTWELMAMPGVETEVSDADCVTAGMAEARGEAEDDGSCPWALGGVPGLCAGAPTVPAFVAAEPLSELPRSVSESPAAVVRPLAPYVTELLRPPRV